MIRVIINGANGKMGRHAVEAVTNAKDLDCVGQCDVGDSLADMITSTQADVVVDLTRPESVLENVTTILKHGAHAVVGTTGLTHDQLLDCDQLGQKQGRSVIVCPNFAIGAILMMKVAADIAPHMDHVEIIEYHNPLKADSPSGTAIKTAEWIQEAAKSPLNSTATSGTETIDGVRGGAHHDIPIHSVRLPGVVANQDVIFGGLGQQLTIRHDTSSREAFMPGICLCIREAMSKSGLYYGLETLLWPDDYDRYRGIQPN